MDVTKSVGYIYCIDGEFLTRIYQNGFMDTPFYQLVKVKDIDMASVFEEKIDVKNSEIEYRNIGAEELVSKCTIVKVERSKGYLIPCTYELLEGVWPR